MPPPGWLLSASNCVVVNKSLFPLTEILFIQTPNLRMIFLNYITWQIWSEYFLEITRVLASSNFSPYNLEISPVVFFPLVVNEFTLLLIFIYLANICQIRVVQISISRYALRRSVIQPNLLVVMKKTHQKLNSQVNLSSLVALYWTRRTHWI